MLTVPLLSVYGVTQMRVYFIFSNGIEIGSQWRVAPDTLPFLPYLYKDILKKILGYLSIVYKFTDKKIYSLSI